METALENQYADELRRQRMAENFNSGISRTHDTNDPNKIRSEIAADEARKRGEGGDGRPQSFRERVMAARRTKDEGEGLKDKITGAIAAPAKQGTSWLLKASWLNLIDSFGLTLIYINLHVFGHWVLGDKFFCKLGEEWAPKLAATGGKEIAKSFGTAGKIAGIIEIMGLLLLDLAVLLIIFMNLALIVIIVSFMGGAGWEGAKLIWELVKGLGWTAVEAIKDLF